MSNKKKTDGQKNPEQPRIKATRAAINRYKELLRNPVLFAGGASKTMLRNYQREAAESIFDSVIGQRGISFVVIFPRQTGKNELQAQLEAYLMTLFSNYPVEMIKVSPTQVPQAQISMRRFEKVMRKNFITKDIWKKESKSSYKLGEARISFLSAAPTSNIVGATASGLLEVDEAQDVTILKFDRDVSPMSAATNATRVFWGTAWTSATLLGRELRAAAAAEKADGRRRVFRLSAEDVYAEVPAYRRHVEEKIARMGRNHPTVRSQYFSEEVDGAGGMFPAGRLALMRGASSPADAKGERLTALLLDVAGEDEGARSLTGEVNLSNPARDATALTLVEIVPDAQDSKAAPVYHPLRRWQWIGANHNDLQKEIRGIVLGWNVRAVVVDATGVGAGLASFLDRALPGKVTPFTFNSASKSQLGWDFLAVVDSGRWQEPPLTDLPGDDQLRFQNEFFSQLTACQFEVKNDAKHTMRWQVPDGSRDPQSGEALHDDWVLSAALCAVLEKMDWHAPSVPFIVTARDPLNEMEGKY